MGRTLVRHRSEAIGEGERRVERASGRSDAGHIGNEGSAVRQTGTPGVTRETVTPRKARFGPSERRPRPAVGADRKMVPSQSGRPPGTAPRGWQRTLANGRRRHPFRRPFALLCLEGGPSAIKLIACSTAKKGTGRARKPRCAAQGPHGEASRREDQPSPGRWRTGRPPAGRGDRRAMSRKSRHGPPFPGQTHPAGRMRGVPREVKRFRMTALI